MPSTCRVCGCTDSRACIRLGADLGGTPLVREVCAWAAPDLCTACTPDAGENWIHPEPLSAIDQLREQLVDAARRQEQESAPPPTHSGR